MISKAIVCIITVPKPMAKKRAYCSFLPRSDQAPHVFETEAQEFQGVQAMAWLDEPAHVAWG